MGFSKDYRSLSIGIFEKVILLAVAVFLGGLIYYAHGIFEAYRSIKIIEDKIEQPPYTVFSQRITSKAESLEAAFSAATDRDLPQPVDRERAEYTPLLEQINKELWNFADRTRQLAPVSTVTDGIFEKCRAVQEYIPIRQNLETLLSQLRTLQEQVDALNALDRLDFRYYTWADFLTFYFDGVADAIEKMKMRKIALEHFNDKQEKKIEKGKKDALLVFSLFCIAMMCFVITSIQKNTHAILLLKDLLVSTGKAGDPLPAAGSGGGEHASNARGEEKA